MSALVLALPATDSSLAGRGPSEVFKRAVECYNKASAGIGREELAPPEKERLLEVLAEGLERLGKAAGPTVLIARFEAADGRVPRLALHLVGQLLSLGRAAFVMPEFKQRSFGFRVDVR